MLGMMVRKQCLGIMQGYSAQDMPSPCCRHAPWDHCAEHCVQEKGLDGLREVVPEPGQAKAKAQVQSAQEEAAQAEAKSKVDGKAQAKPPAGSAPQQLVRQRPGNFFQVRIGKGARRQLASHLHQEWRENR